MAARVPSNSTLRYRNDPIYRSARIAANREYVKDKNKYPLFRKLHKLRNAISNYKDSIKYHQHKITLFRNRIYKAQRAKEKLEIEWGQMRKKLKQEGIY